jgi:hypothetical protein
MMLTSTSIIVPVPCSAAREGVVELPADSKRLSKLSGAQACQVARRKVLEHVALGHGNRLVQHKSPPLVGFTSLLVASLLLPATAAASPLMSMEATSPSPPFGTLSRVNGTKNPITHQELGDVFEYCFWPSDCKAPVTTLK